MRLKGKLAKGGVVAALTAVGLFVSATDAFADTTCATFTLAQADWNALDEPYAASSSVYLQFQDDGNLVLYRLSDNYVLWASGTEDRGVTDLDWSQSRGGIILKYSNGSVACYIGSGASNGWAAVQNDGNFVFYAPGKVAKWAMSWTARTIDYCGF